MRFQTSGESEALKEWIQEGADKVRNCKSAKGSRNGNSKLTEEQVAKIKLKLSNGEVRNRLRKEYGVSFQTIDRISKETNWGSV